MNQKSTKGNHAKYLSYQLAHERMKSAIEAGFPLEVVAIAGNRGQTPFSPLTQAIAFG